MVTCALLTDRHGTESLRQFLHFPMMFTKTHAQQDRVRVHSVRTCARYDPPDEVVVVLPVVPI